MRSSRPTRKRVLLVGGGHAHVGVLRAFGMQPEPSVDVTLIAKELDAPYSGMLPGLVAGHYGFDQCHIDLVRLATFAGARLVHGEATGIDRARREVHIAGRPPLRYDLLSIDTGITPLLAGLRGAAEYALPVKPVSEFVPRWRVLEAAALSATGPRRFIVVGTGAAGLEVVLAIRHRLLVEAPRHGIDGDALTFTLIGSGVLLPSHNARARRLARAELEAAGVTLIENQAVVAVTESGVETAGGRHVAGDAVLVTTKAAPPAWFATTDLPRDEAGFLHVRPTLQLLDDPDVFAVGDCATVKGHEREKAGVFAVRQAAPLTDNLRRRARGLAALPFVPQRQFLTLLSLGGKRAIAARGGWAFAGDWAWTWKDHIDRRFMTMFQELPVMQGPDGEAAMRCAGCAAKIGPAPLARALARLPAAPAGLAVRDAMPGDDAALLDLGARELRLESVDFFRAIWPEPYVLGEIAATHALSDILAKGGTPDHALAVAVLPPAASHLAEDDLTQLMAGARAVLDRDGVALVGGHSSEGEALAAGFFVSGTVARGTALPKGALQPGDALILTKRIGTGLLFAGLMRQRARARHIRAALEQMRQSNAAAARGLVAHGARAMTDVTGFGLAGHLIEMLEASGMAARLDLGRVAQLPGVAAMAEAGIRSTLLPENLALADRITGLADVPEATLAVLFDPQTSGGLIAGVPRERAEDCVAALRALAITTEIVGEVEPRTAGVPPLRLAGALRPPAVPGGTEPDA